MARLLALEGAALLNLVVLARLVGFCPSEAQVSVLERALDYKRIGLNCCRQWGKSTIVALMAVHKMLAYPGATVLVVGPAERQSGEFIEKVRVFLRRLGFPKLRGDGVNDVSTRLPNGSRIVGLPAREATTRGFSGVAMLIIAEAAWIPDEVILALTPSLASSDGDLVLLSTPQGRRGYFYREMTAVENEGTWLRHTGPVTECGFIKEKFLGEARRKGEAYFNQEFMCQFVETGKYLFDEERLKKAENLKEAGWRLIL